MGVVAYRLRCSLRREWRTSCGLAVIVALAGGLALTLAAGSVRTLTAPDRYTDAAGVQADVVVEQQQGRPATERIGQLPGVRSIRSATFVFGALTPRGEDQPLESLVFAGSPDAIGNRITSGRAPDGARPGDFCASQGFVDRIRASIGDRFRLMTISQATAVRSGFDAATPDGPAIDARLVCTMSGPSELQDAYAVAIFPTTLFTIGDIGTSATEHAVQLDPGASPTRLRSELDGLGDGEYGVTTAEVVPAIVRDAVQARGIGIAVVAAIVGIATVVVLGQIIGRQFRLPGPQRSALLALGMTDRQLVADPIARAAPSVLIGTSGALVVSLVASAWFPLGFVDVVEPSPGLRIDPSVLLVGGVALAGGVILWATVAIAVGDRGPRWRRGPGLLDGLGRRLRPLTAGIGVRFLANRGAPGSAAASFAGLVLVMSAVVGALTFGVSLARLVETPSWYGNTDAAIGQGGDAVAPEVVDALTRSRAVRGLALAETIVGSVDGQTIDVTGLDPVRGDVQPVVRTGRTAAGPDEIALGAVTASDLGVGVGDHIDISTSAGSHRSTVTGIVIVPSVNGGDGVGQGGLVTASGMRRLDPSAMPSVALVDLVGTADRSTLRRLSAEVGVGAGPADPPGSILNLDRVRTLPFVVAASLGVLAAMALVHQLLVAARHRRRDLAVLGALGARPGWTASIVRWQATLLAAGAMVVATPLGLAAGRLTYQALVNRTGAVDQLTVPVAWLLVTAAMAVVVANAAAAVPAWRVRRQHLATELTRE